MLKAILVGSLIGIGGPFVTICSTIRFIPDIIAGRGRLALVITALMFAFLDAFQLQVQGGWCTGTLSIVVGTSICCCYIISFKKLFISLKGYR